MFGSLKRKFVLVLFVLAAMIPASAQSNKPKANQPDRGAISDEIKATPAYAEILLRKTELESVIVELMVSYTEDFPKLKNARYEVSLLESEFEKFAKLKEPDTAKFTLALGKLIVRRAEIATDHWVLTNRYSDVHPDVKKAKQKLEIFDKAIDSIL